MALWQGLPAERPAVGEVAALPDVEQPLAVGDVLVAVNGAPVADFERSLRRAQAMNPPGPMRVSVERGGETLDLTVPYPLPAKLDMGGAAVPGERRRAEGGGPRARPPTGDRSPRSSSCGRSCSPRGGRTMPLTVWRDGGRWRSRSRRRSGTPSADGGFERRVMIGAAGAPLYRTATVTPGPLTAPASAWSAPGRSSSSR